MLREWAAAFPFLPRPVLHVDEVRDQIIAGDPFHVLRWSALQQIIVDDGGHVGEQEGPDIVFATDVL